MEGENGGTEKTPWCERDGAVRTVSAAGLSASASTDKIGRERSAPDRITPLRAML
jgi:hypothetical protein